MAETTNISWADATWNPWRGCIKVSAGCKYCYMYRQEERFGRDPFRVEKSRTTFEDPLKWITPRRIFTCSLSDFFIEQSDEWRTAAWEIIKKTPQHIYMILTKRTSRIWSHLPDDWGTGWPNVWLGATVESNGFHCRLQELAGIPAAVKFVSVEPMLGPVDLSPWLRDGKYFQWVICGGESGPHHRPLDMTWARALRDQCVRFRVPFFFKQDSNVRPGQRPYVVEEDGSHTAWQQIPNSTTQSEPEQLRLFQ
jgi:protein gp37